MEDPSHPTRRILSSAADLALVLSRDGTVVDVWLSGALEDEPGWRALVGRPWADTVLEDSRRKVDKLLEDAFAGREGATREINQVVEGVGEVPVRFALATLDDEHAVAPGRDIRPIAEMQQRLISAQQEMEAEYRRLRQADTPYRVLFRLSSEGVVVVDAKQREVVEANPAAARLLGEPVGAMSGTDLAALLAPESRDALMTLIGAVEGGGSDTRSQVLARDGSQLTVAASMFRQSGEVYLLFRLRPAEGAPAMSPRSSRLLEALESIPDGFVVTDEELRVLSANAAFIELVQRGTEAQVVGQPLARWVGRPNVDLNIIQANLRERGVVREFATVVRSEFELEQEAVLTAVSVSDGEAPCIGFSIRSVASRVARPAATGATFLPRSAERLRGLVGRVSLKEIVKESTDLIERLCIEAALDVSNNNRAAAAQLLGLSRQSLYSKLRRHGIAEFH
ncbi:MAG TPA: transcriptional regulator PpsR [Sandaracinaceae bacterium LLY-WYZ-13_1]|nr:transcriptional regulator PpsR [Sandaracinaceae bacterium LLY-WYZ-13_1]